MIPGEYQIQSGNIASTSGEKTGLSSSKTTATDLSRWDRTITFTR